MKKKRNKKIDFNNLTIIMFAIYIVVCIFANTILYTTNDVFKSIVKIIQIIYYLYFAFNIIREYINGSKITIPIVIIGILSIIIYIFSGNLDIFIYIVVLVSLRNVDINKTIKVCFYSMFTSYIIIILLSLIGIIPNILYITSTLNLDKVSRYCLGFISPTDTFNHYFIIVLLYVFYRGKNAKIYEVVLLLLIDLFIFKYTYGRTGFILTTLSLTVSLLYKYNVIDYLLKIKFFNYLFKIVCYVFPILIFSFFMFSVVSFRHDGEFGKYVNSKITGRVYLTSLAIDDYGIPLFGKGIIWYGWGGYGYDQNIDTETFHYNYIDTSYSRMIFDYGIIFTAFIIFSYTVLLKDSFLKKKYLLSIIIIILLMWAVMEPNLINVRKNIFMLFFIPYLELGEIKFLNFLNIKKLFIK